MAVDGWFNPFDHSFLDDLCDHDVWRWVPLAACKDIADPDVFFATDGRSHIDLLKRICDICPVQAECLDYALAHNEYGWWGGTSRKERRRLLGGGT